MGRPGAGSAFTRLERAALAAVLLTFATATPAAFAASSGGGGSDLPRVDPRDSALLDSLARARAANESAPAPGLAAIQRSSAAPPAGSASALAAVVSGASPNFTLRRIVNPAYRPPNAGGPGLPLGATPALRALDWASAQVSGRGAGPASRVLDWTLSAGEDARQERAWAVEAAGTRRPDRDVLRMLRLDARRKLFAASLGDVPPQVVGQVASLQRLRGAAFQLDARDGSRVRLMGGAPTPLPGQSARRVTVGGVAIDEARFDVARVSFSTFAYGVDAAPRAPVGIADPDSAAGAGALMSVGIRTPLALGTLGSTVTTGWHRRGGESGPSAQHALEWTYGSPRVVISLLDQCSAGRAGVLGNDRIAPAPRHDDRWNAQARILQGRVETHFTGAVRAGGDAALDARTMAVGGSGSFGRSAWYGGGELAWDQRALAASTERRVSVYTGRVSVAAALLVRAERSTNDLGRDVLLLSGEGSLSLPRGGRLTLEPRFGWDAGRLERGALGTRLAWPFTTLGLRLGAGLVVGATSSQGFRGGLQEAELTLSLAPRTRDRGELELRHLSDSGTEMLEYTASYDLQAPRYATGGGWLSSRRDSSRLTVQVVRSGNRTGVQDVLVSLDGRELRFTDADGWAHFDHVAEGVHLLAIEERSVPSPYVAVSATRVFVTLERGRLPDPVRFEIGRQERHVTF